MDKEEVDEGYKLTSIGNRSLFMNRCASVYYQPGKTVAAPLFLAHRGYHPTYFETLEDALRMAYQCKDRYVIWRVIAHNPVRLPPRLYTAIMDYSGKFPIHIQEVHAGWPTGTKMAKGIRLIEKVAVGPPLRIIKGGLK